jgi:hypothetical protein
MRKAAPWLLAVAIVLAFAAVGCRKKTETAAYPPAGTEAPRAAAVAHIERITVAKAVNSNESPGEAASAFGGTDTVYVSMWTANAPAGTEIKARWLGPDGQQLTEDRIVTDRAGDGYTSFHAANSNGWAPGTYRVEILLNGAPAGSTTFTVS